jgi:hypothetical protein
MFSKTVDECLHTADGHNAYDHDGAGWLVPSLECSECGAIATDILAENDYEEGDARPYLIIDWQPCE